MSRKWIVALATMAAAGGIAAAATAVLGQGSGLDRADVTRLDVSVSKSGAAAAGVPATTSGKTKIVYLTSDPQTVDAGAVDVDIGDCPKKSKVLNGTYETDNVETALIGTRPLTKRRWRLTLNQIPIDGTISDYQAVFGVVCAKAGKKK